LSAGLIRGFTRGGEATGAWSGVALHAAVAAAYCQYASLRGNRGALISAIGRTVRSNRGTAARRAPLSICGTPCPRALA